MSKKNNILNQIVRFLVFCLHKSKLFATFAEINNMKTYPVIQDFAHLCVKMDDKITPQRREGCYIPDRPKTLFEQRWDAMSDLQKMQLQGLLKHYSEELTQQ